MNKLLLMAIAGYAGYKLAQYEQTAREKNHPLFAQNWSNRGYNSNSIEEWKTLTHDKIVEIESEAYGLGRKEAGNDKDFIATRYNELFSDGE